MFKPKIENPEIREILQDDLTTGYDSTDRLGKRIEGYATLKERTKEWIDWAKDGGIPQFKRPEIKLFKKLDTCASYLIFRNYLVSKQSKLLGSCTCKEHLLCAFCAARRGVKNASAYQERVDQLKQENPDQKLLLITFTVKNGEDLWERFSHLRTSMQTMTKRRNHSLKRDTPSTIKFINGGVFAYEFKRGSNLNLWHPHIHMLALIDSTTFLDAQAIKDEWFQITGDSTNINFKYCTDNSAFLEVFAYALKFSEMEHQDRWFAFNLLKGERLISSFGSFRGVICPDNLNDELLDTDEPWMDVLYRYRTWQGYDSGMVIDSSDIPRGKAA